jgi:cell division protein FtsL
VRIQNWYSYNPRNRKRKRQVFLSLVLLALILAVGYAYVWQRVYTLKLAKQHAAQRQLVGTLNERCESLRYEVEQLASMDRIETIARNRLDLLNGNEATLAGSRIELKSRSKHHTTKPKETSSSSVAEGSGGI